MIYWPTSKSVINLSLDIARKIFAFIPCHSCNEYLYQIINIETITFVHVSLKQAQEWSLQQQSSLKQPQYAYTCLSVRSFSRRIASNSNLCVECKIPKWIAAYFQIDQICLLMWFTTPLTIFINQFLSFIFWDRNWRNY